VNTSLTQEDPWGQTYFTSTLFTLTSLQYFDTFGQQEGHSACKYVGVDLSMVTIWLELCPSIVTTTFIIILSSNKLQMVTFCYRPYSCSHYLMHS